jgi:hypothetical protein
MTVSGFIAGEFEPYFNHLDLMNLPNHDIYLKLMIDGTPSHPSVRLRSAPSKLFPFSPLKQGTRRRTALPHPGIRLALVG